MSDLFDIFGKNQDIQSTPCEPGVSRKILTYNKTLMLVEVCFAKGAKGKPHAHVHEQATYVAKGRFRFTVGEQTREVSEGDSVLMPSGVLHEAHALEDGVLVDVFSPLREDFLAQKI